MKLKGLYIQRARREGRPVDSEERSVDVEERSADVAEHSADVEEYSADVEVSGGRVAYQVQSEYAASAAQGLDCKNRVDRARIQSGAYR
eukprot:4071217-Pyramimonas_sp.AAC.1